MTAATSARNCGSPTAGTRQPQRLDCPALLGTAADGWRSSPWRECRPGAGEPVCHVSYYEADAFAAGRGPGCPPRLNGSVGRGPGIPLVGNFLESGRFHPAAVPPRDARPRTYSCLRRCLAMDRSPYTPYPGFRPAAGALGEYNGKFMCNQLVCGAVHAPPPDRLRPTYRNFFPPEAPGNFPASG